MDSIDPQFTQSSASLAAAYMTSLLPALEAEYNLDTAALLERVGLDSNLLQNPQALIPFYRVGAFFLELLKETQDPGLGLVVGSGVQPRSYQVLGYAVLSSANLGQAIERLIRYEHLVGKLGSTTLQRDGELVRLIWHCPFEGPWSRYIKEAAVTGWVVYARSLLASQVKAEAVHFDHELVGECARYEAVYDCPVIFGSDWTGVTFDSGLLDEPLISADPGLNQMMEAHARDMLSQFKHKLNLVNEVREVVARILPTGEPVLEEVAQSIGLTGRALQNRLKSGGYHFKDVVDEVREQLAYAYLQNSDTSIIDIAFLLGFSEQSSFSRAFRRWTGMAPVEYRRRNR